MILKDDKNSLQHFYVINIERHKKSKVIESDNNEKFEKTND